NATYVLYKTIYFFLNNQGSEKYIPQYKMIFSFMKRVIVHRNKSFSQCAIWFSQYGKQCVGCTMENLHPHFIFLPWLCLKPLLRRRHWAAAQSTRTATTPACSFLLTANTIALRWICPPGGMAPTFGMPMSCPGSTPRVSRWWPWRALRFPATARA